MNSNSLAERSRRLTSSIGSLTGWNFEYFDQPDEDRYEVRKSFPSAPHPPAPWNKERLLMLFNSGTHGSTLLSGLEGVDLTITAFGVPLVDRVILTVVVTDSI
jgi:hypothetical protein